MPLAVDFPASVHEHLVPTREQPTFLHGQVILTIQAIDRRILDLIEALARQEGFARLVLETGAAGYEAAQRVYERAGFHRCGPVLDYPDSGYSVFFDKLLTASGSQTT